nr:hypothetical protein [Tanacetum cinerariifolium]
MLGPSGELDGMPTLPDGRVVTDIQKKDKNEAKPIKPSTRMGRAQKVKV